MNLCDGQSAKATGVSNDLDERSCSLSGHDPIVVLDRPSRQETPELHDATCVNYRGRIDPQSTSIVIGGHTPSDANPDPATLQKLLKL
jgi:hypothetical protein